MFKNFVTFKDAVEFSVQDVPEQILDFYQDKKNFVDGEVVPLRIRIAATHAARPTRNHGLYLPSKMRKGTPTFLKPFPKPILTHHNHKSDAIGRVSDAKYIDISSGVYKTVQDSFDAEYLKKLRDFTDGKLDKTDAVNFAIEFLDLQNAFDADFEGLGYIELLADITDPDAIQKVLDKRYLTGSVNASTNSAICTICKIDWADGERCEHMPGEVYDKKVCLLIAGDLMYHEYSMVNKPADNISGIIEISVNGITDSVQIKPRTNSGHSREAIYEIAFTEKRTEQGDNHMTFKEAMDLLRESGKFDNAILESKDFMTATKKAIKDAENLESLLVSLKDFAVEKTEETETKDTETEIKDEVKDFFGEAYDEVVGDDPWGRQYAEMLLTLLEDAEDPEAVKKEIEDAKLSSSARKKLPDSAFCGPDRSFPVNDCAHYTAALRLLSRYEGPGDKGKIRACINRKGKRLSCSTDKKDNTQPEPTVYSAVDYFDQFEDNEVKDMFQGLLLAIDDRALDCGYSDNSEKIKQLEDEIKTLKETKNLSDSEEKIDKQLETAKTEIKYLQEDIEHMSQALVDSEASIKQLYAQQIADLSLLSGTETNVEEILDSVKNDKETELQQKLKTIKEKVDIQKLADTLNSGLTNPKPQETIDNPLGEKTIEDDKEEKEVNITNELLQDITARYLTLRLNHGKSFADSWLEQQKQLGVIPKELPTPQQ